MKYICPECGSEIPEDAEFCYICGRKKDNTIRLDQSGHFIQPEENKCASCGAEMLPDDLFCPNCGEPISKTQLAAFRPKMVKYGWVGLALALIAGALGFVPGAIGFLPTLPSIFGLGHLYFKKWARGVIFLLFSAFFYYLRITTEMNIWISIFFQVIAIFIYLLQAMEVFVLAFMPPKQPSDNNDR